MGDQITSLFSDPFSNEAGSGRPFEIGGPSPTPTRPTSLFSDPDESRRLQDASRRAATTPPERAARVLQQQRLTGLPTELIDRNLDAIEQQTNVRNFDAERFRRESPLLAQWLTSERYRTAVAQDDLAPLSALERAWGTARNVLGAAGAGVLGFSQGIYGAVQAAAESVSAAPGGLNRMVGQLPATTPAGQMTPGNVDLFQQPAVQNADGTHSTVDSFSVNIDGREVLLPTVTPDGRHLSQADALAEYEKTGRHLGIFDTPENATAFAQQLHEDYAAGKYDNGAASAVADFARGSAAVAGDLARRLRGPQTGVGFVEHNLLGGIEGAAQMAPALVAGTLAGPATLLGALGVSGGGQGYAEARQEGAGVGRSLAYGGLQAAIQVGTDFIPAHRLLGDLAVNAPLIKTLAHQVMPAILGTEIATAFQDLNAWAFLPANKDRTMADYLAERPSAAAATLINTIAAVGSTTAVAHGTARILDNISGAAQRSTTIKRAPGEVRDFATQATADSPVSTVHLPIDSFTTYWQTKGEDPAAVAEKLTGSPDAYAQAQQTGTDLAVPMGAYVTEIAASKEHGAFFAQEGKLNPEALNLRESRALDQQMAEQLQAAPAADAASTAGQIRDAVKAKLDAAGIDPDVAKTHAAMFESTFQTLAARAGLDPVELFNRYPLDVQREGVTPEGTPAADETTLFQGEPDGRRAQLEERIATARASGHEDLQAVAELRDLQDAAVPVPVAEPGAAAVAPIDPRVDPTSPDFFRQDKRGSIRFGKDGTVRIDLLRHADLTTLIHEGSHFYAKVLGDLADEIGTRDPASLTDTQRQMVDDHGTLLKWVGAESRAAMTTAQHEQIARGFEAYVLRGEAPSIPLRGVFARMFAWLKSVYKNGRALGVELTPEVAGVFDRLVATDDAIAAAQREAHVQPLFTDAIADAAGFSEADRATYRARVQEATDNARSRLQGELLQQLQRERTTWWQNEREAIRAEIAPELAARPEQRALAFLQDGTQPDGSPLPAGAQPFKLSERDLVAQFGPETVSRLPAGVSARDGVPLAVAADVLGFRSGSALVRALGNTEPLKAAVGHAADAEMQRRHGDLLLDGSITERARHAVMEAGADVFTAEMHGLADAAQRQTGGSRPTVPPAAALRSLAERRIAETTVRELRPGAYAAAARRAGEDALREASRQDFAAAFQAKQRQALNAELYRAATAARVSVDNFLAEIKPIYKPDTTLAKTYELDLVYAARALLSQYELGPRGKEQSVAGYLDKVRRYDPETYADLEAAIDAASQPSKPYREMTVSELTALRDAVANLWHVARRSKQIMINGEARELADVRTDVLQQVEKFSTPQEKAGYTRAVSRWDRAKVGLQGLAARMRRVEDWVTVVDNGREGPARTAIYEPVNAGAIAYDRGRTDAAARYAEIAGKLDIGKRFGEIAAPELNYTFQNKHQELLGALLHVGNGFEPGSNGYKLLVGRKWGEVGIDGRVDTAPWRAFVARMAREGVLTKADYDYVQAVWDLNESFKADAQRTHHSRYGRYFDEVTRVPFETAFGHYEGGYFPAIADPFITPLAADRAEANALLDGGAGGSTMFPHVNRGFSKSRTLTYAKPLILDTSAVLSHINSVLRFTHLSEPVHDVARLILHNSFRSHMDAIDPAAVSDLLKPYLDRAASQQMFVPMQGKAGRALDTIARAIRVNGALQLVALNATVLAEQTTHAPAVLAHPDVSAGKLLAGVWRLSREPRVMAREIHEASPYMATRESAGLTEAHAALDRILIDANPAQRAGQWVRDHATVLTRGIQSVMDLSTWQAVYDKVSSEPGASHDQAVKRADSAVRQALGSYRPQDRSSAEGGHQIIGLLNPFYGFFNAKLNMMGTEAVLASRLGVQRRFSRGFAVYALGFMIPAMAGEAIKNVLHGKSFTGEGDDEDAATALFKFWGISQGKMAARMVPGGGAALDVLARSFGAQSGGHVLNTPAITMVENSLHAPGEIYRALTDSDNMTPAQKSKAITDFFTMLGMLSGQPLRPVGQAVNAIRDADDEQ